MFNPNFTDWSAWGKDLCGPGIELQNFMNRIFGKITKENISTSSSNLAANVQYAQDLEKSNTIDKMLKTNLNYISACNADLVQHSQKMLAIYAEAIAGITDLSKDNMTEAFAKANVQQTSN